MPDFLAPGIYMQEVSSGARPIEAVGTSVAGFVGWAPDADAHLQEAYRIDNWSQFKREFATAEAGQTLASTPLSHAVSGFFENGGRTCWIVNVGAADKGVSGGGEGDEKRGLELFEAIDEIAIVAAPGFTDTTSHEALVSHCENGKNRIAILDPPEKLDSIRQLITLETVAAPEDKPGAAAPPAAPAAKLGPAAAPPAPAAPAPAQPKASSGLMPRTSDRGYSAFYYPWIVVRDALKPTASPVAVAPSGHVAGIYARSDATRGVHKAPANELVAGALNVSRLITQEEQGSLNPSGVNCIRLFDRDGIRVYGARTRADSSSEWKYVNVRRLFIMIEQSIIRSTRWVVFEPNDRPLWKALRRDVVAFLTTIWRQGALKGRTAEEAFFVRCDDETNPQEEIDLGRVNIEIGLAPVKPAEFVIFRIGQSADATRVEAVAS